jgi:hypothetical protein
MTRNDWESQIGLRVRDPSPASHFLNDSALDTLETTPKSGTQSVRKKEKGPGGEGGDTIGQRVKNDTMRHLLSN